MVINKLNPVGQRLLYYAGSWPYLIGVTIASIALVLAFLPPPWLFAALGLVGLAPAIGAIGLIASRPRGVRADPKPPGPPIHIFYFLNITEIEASLSQIEGGRLRESTERLTTTGSAGANLGAASGNVARGVEHGRTVEPTDDSNFKRLYKQLSEIKPLDDVKLNKIPDSKAIFARFALNEFWDLQIAVESFRSDGGTVEKLVEIDARWGKLCLDSNGATPTGNNLPATGQVTVMGRVASYDRPRHDITNVTLKIFAVYR